MDYHKNSRADIPKSVSYGVDVTSTCPKISKYIYPRQFIKDAVIPKTNKKYGGGGTSTYLYIVVGVY